MDSRLVAWARAVKSRSGKSPAGRSGPAGRAVLWMFTDAARLADPLAAARALPPGLGGVVLRDDLAPGRLALGQALARLCRQRRLALVVAGDWRLARRLRAGLHLRGGRWPAGAPPGWALLTSSAHDRVELARARARGATLAFVSPAFPTPSHPGAGGLGAVRWAALAKRARVPVAGLGGIDGATARRLPRWAAGAGAIGAISPGR